MDMKRAAWARRLARVLVLGVLIVASSGAIAQEVIFFALKGDGTASVVLDRRQRIAWITDGGRGGEKGIAAARIGSLTLIEFLKREQITKIAIVCSHPHSDHMGGLIDFVERVDLSGFHLRFVDTHAHPPPPNSLFGRYSRRTDLSAAGGKYEHWSAAGQDAFVGFAAATGDVVVSNFVYQATGSSDHDRSVIMQYVLEGGAQAIVDFDDASTRLVKEWVRREGARASVLVHPHHGSRNNSIDEVLKSADKVGLTDVVFTVNRENRYLHPAPEVAYHVIRELGADHVFVTDSDLGENVVVDATGVRVPDKKEHRRRLAIFFTAQMQRHQALARELFAEQMIAATDAFAGAGAGAQKWLPVVHRLVASGQLDPKRANKLDGHARAILICAAILERIETGRDRVEKGILGMVLRRSGPTAPGMRVPSTPDTPAPGGGSAYFWEQVGEMMAELHEKHGGRSVLTGAPAELRLAYQHELSRWRPRFGGVILGNETSGSKVAFVEFASTRAAEGGNEARIVRVTLTDGSAADYVDLTSDELWSAYNFVQPATALVARHAHKPLVGNLVGVVGLSCGVKESCRAALHPALVDTALGWDALRADGISSAAQRQQSLPADLPAINWSALQADALQWYDAPSTISTEFGVATVQPSLDTNGSCLLTLRLVDSPSTESVSAKVDVMLAQLAERGQFRLRAAEVGELVRKARNDPELWTHRTIPSAAVSAMCNSYMPLIRMDRLARAVALLNWARDSMGRSLPALPSDVNPLWRPTPIEWPQADAMSVQTISWSAEDISASDKPVPKNQVYILSFVVVIFVVACLAVVVWRGRRGAGAA
jgi:beta-lactamase superfamily II metal-dependent hydrolase